MDRFIKALENISSSNNVRGAINEEEEKIEFIISAKPDSFLGDCFDVFVIMEEDCYNITASPRVIFSLKNGFVKNDIEEEILDFKSRIFVKHFSTAYSFWVEEISDKNLALKICIKADLSEKAEEVLKYCFSKFCEFSHKIMDELEEKCDFSTVVVPFDELYRLIILE